MELLAQGLDGADQGRAHQSADVLADGEQDDEADHVLAPALQHLAEAQDHGRADEEGGGEGQQGLAEIELGRARQHGGVAVDEGADGDHDQGDRDRLPQLHRIEGEGADQGPRRRGDQHDQEQTLHLLRDQPHLLQEADRAGGLFRQDDPHQQDGQKQPHQVAARQPLEVDQRVGPVVFDQDGGGQQHDRPSQGPADPRRLGPPDDAAQTQHRRQQGHARREQGEGDEVQFLEHPHPLRRRHAQGEDGGQGDQHQPQLEHVEGPPLIQVQQAHDAQSRQGNG